MKEFWKVWTSAPPQTWIVILMLFNFVFWNKYKFFYYMAIFSLDMTYVALGKLVYAAPRPYMMDEQIEALKCEKEFGKPSGHSSGCSLFLITMTLDLFHGAKLPNMQDADVQYYTYFKYIVIVSFFIFYSVSIAYTRFLVGVHSLDQIVFGWTLGTWSGLTLHFLIRDNLVKHVQMLYQWQA